jgi:hypothetical protein
LLLRDEHQLDDPAATCNLSEVNLIDGFNDQWQAASVRLRLFVRMLVVKAIASMCSSLLELGKTG